MTLETGFYMILASVMKGLSAFLSNLLFKKSLRRPEGFTDILVCPSLNSYPYVIIYQMLWIYLRSLLSLQGWDIDQN